jgi:hypothetical protein
VTRTTQPAVEWLSVPALWQRTRGQIVSHVAARFADPRRPFARLDASVEPLGHAAEPAEEVWIDYVADVGDGYQATRAVAVCQSQPLAQTSPGRLLVFGGDEVYPVASHRAYDQRFRLPYDGLLERRDAVLALPGNHDWYDRLRAFPEVFTPAGNGSLPNAVQRCSYWSCPLPGGTWWMWGRDFGLEGRLDAPQEDHFRQRRDELAALARPVGLVICTAEPFWEKGETTMAATVESLIPPNATSVVHLSGDQHHLAVWHDDAVAALDRERIYVTAGGGGAYLSFTDAVPDAVPLPAAPPSAPEPGQEDRPAPPSLPRRDVYPPPRSWTARSFARTLVPRGWRLSELGLLPVTAAVYLILAGLLAAAAGARAPRGTGAFEWATQGSVPATRWKLLEAAGTSGWCIGAGVTLLALCVGMAFERGRRPRLRRLGLGTAHAVVQAALAITIAAFAVELAGLLDGVGRGVVYALVMALAGAFAANGLLIGYLIVAARLGVNLNAAAAAVASPHHKNFVRLHLTADGELEVIPFVIERTDGDERELPARCERRRSYRLDPLRRLATSAAERMRQ